MKLTPLLLLSIGTLAIALASSTLAQQQPASPNDTTVVCIPLNVGWNLVSNPVRRAPGTDSIPQVFCGAQCPWVVGWGIGYVINCRVKNGTGYWFKVPSPNPYCCIEGATIEVDSILLTAGWNMIGAITHPVPVSSIYSIPPNIKASPFFKFSSGYQRADTLYPGVGYWVKSMQSGRLVVSSGI